MIIELIQIYNPIQTEQCTEPKQDVRDEDKIVMVYNKHCSISLPYPLWRKSIPRRIHIENKKYKPK